MGVYDTFGHIQIKAGLCNMIDYEIGDKTPLPDGVYVAPDGVVVIVKGIFVAEFDHLIDKWGGRLDCNTILDARHPMNQAILEVTKP